MNGGVEILLARMETHPEEFFTDSRWRSLIMDFANDLDKDDLMALDKKVRECRQQQFTELIMQRLIGEEDEERKLARRHAIKTVPQFPTGTRFADLADKDEDMAEDGFSPAQRMAIKRAKGEI